MVEQIHEVLCVIVRLYATSEIEGVLPTAVLYDIAKFAECVKCLDMNFDAQADFQVTRYQNSSKDLHISESAAGNGENQAIL